MNQEESLRQALELEAYNQDTMKMVDELIKDLPGLSIVEKSKRLNTILFKYIRLEETDRTIVRELLVDKRVVTKKAFNEKIKELQTIDEGDKKRKSEKVVYTAHFQGLVDIVNHEGKPAFLVLKEGGELAIMPQFEIDGTIYCPPPKDQIPFLLPEGGKVFDNYQSDDDASLYENLFTYFKETSELPSEDYYHLLAAWTLHTYLLEKFNFSPEIVFFSSLSEKGKTRTGKAVIYVSYRGQVIESVREANIFRQAQNYGGSIFFDCMAFWKKIERNGSEDIILNRYEKGCHVPRVLYPERGPFKDTEYYEIFGPTVIATNESIHNILESRAIQIIMHKSFRNFENDITPEKALPLKERLVAFRARYMNKELPSIQKPFRGRFGDITKPLIQIIRLVTPKYEKNLISLFEHILGEKTESRRDSIEYQILQAILGLEDEVSQGFLSTEMITEQINKDISEKWQVGSRSVGRKLRGLGFVNTVSPDGKERGIKVNCQTLLKLLSEFDEKNIRTYVVKKCQICQRRQGCTVYAGLGFDINLTSDSITSMMSNKRQSATTGKHKASDVSDVSDVSTQGIHENNLNNLNCETTFLDDARE